MRRVPFYFTAVNDRLIGAREIMTGSCLYQHGRGYTTRKLPTTQKKKKSTRKKAIWWLNQLPWKALVISDRLGDGNAQRGVLSMRRRACAQRKLKIRHPLRPCSISFLMLC